MKNKLRLVLSTSLMFGYIAAPVLVYAEQTQTATTGSSTNKSLATEDQKRATRVEAYKKNLKETLTAAGKTRIESRCVASQNVVKGKTTSNTEVTDNRTKAYNEITSKLHTLSATLAARNIDVAKLNTDLTVLQAKITSFAVVNSTYQQALSDLATIDCKADPTAFKAALATARTNQDAVMKAAKEVRSYLKDTIKPVLQSLKIEADRIK